MGVLEPQALTGFSKLQVLTGVFGTPGINMDFRNPKY